MKTRQVVRTVVGVLIVMSICAISQATAGVRSQALREITEALVRRPPAGMTREMAEALGDDLVRIASRHGDELVATACEKASPRLVVRLLREAGKEGEQAALKLLARHGDNAVWVVQRPKALAIFMKFGDEAGEALVKHGSIAEPLIENYGPSMARAASRVNTQNARRLAMLHQEGILQKMPHREEVLDVIARYGDRAADWVWRNKGSIAVASVAAAFVADPEGFLNGTSQILGVVSQPVTQAVSHQLGAFVFGMAIVLGGAAVFFVILRRTRRAAWDFVNKWWRRRREEAAANQASAPSATSVSQEIPVTSDGKATSPLAN